VERNSVPGMSNLRPFPIVTNGDEKGMVMVEYRRGVAGIRKNDLWHWIATCESYPTRAFAILMDKPSSDDLCSRCAALA